MLVCTGAGISAESGVPTFRGPGGLWRTFKAEDLATPEAFRKDPALVWEWYRWRRELVARCQPNAAHLALARWSNGREGVTLVTQNVDDLHERAGSRNVIRLHGSLMKDKCSACDFTRDACLGEAGEPPRCPGCGALLRPATVWFGEMLPERELDQAFAAACRANVCLVIGTAGAVQPAAGIVQEAREAGARVVVVDPGPTEFDRLAEFKFAGNAGEVVPELLG